MRLVLALLFVGGTLVGVLTEGTLSVAGYVLGLVGMVALVVALPPARMALAERFPRTAGLGGRIVALDRRTIGLTFTACIAAFVVAEVIEDALEPGGRLADHLARTYGEDDPRAPLLVAAELHDAWPAEDQRYTAVGVLLRYERDIVALVPDGDGGTRVERYDDDEGYRRFHAYLGDFWGPTYLEEDDVVRSELSVPDDEDLRAVTRRLERAGRVQGLCYGWDVEIRSGRREGRLTGPPIPGDCAYVKLVGWIDPNAGRLGKGSPGRWGVNYEWTTGGEIAQASVEALSVPLVEMIEGATQEPDGRGARAGKGLLEYLDVMPLLALDVDGIPPVEVGTPFGVPADVRPTPVQRTDAERRADDSWKAFPPAILRVGAALGLLFLLGALVVAGVVRLVRAIR